jgi:hypothetical protein
VRNWLLVVALVVGLFIELVLPQLPGASEDPLDPDRVIQDATGGTALTPTSTAAAELFYGPNVLDEDGVKHGPSNALIDAATDSRTHASSIFGHALGMDGHQTGESPRGEASASSGPSRQEKRDRHADSAPSKIHR